MINRVVNFLKKYNLENKTIIVGFSGGYDSMCLLDILAKIKNMPDFDELSIIAAHFNHNWRGNESLKEQEVCRIFSSSRGFDFYTKTAPDNIKKTENDARIARYQFFEDAYEEYDADAVFTAHNRDDNAETVLYRVIKGTGIVGLRGIAEKRGYFYRPLLTTYRTEIMHYCEEYNLTPNNDSSNSNTAYKRNFLRLNVLPTLEKINPEVKEALNTLAENATSDNEIIEDYLNNIRSKVFNGNSMISSEFNQLSVPVKKRLLYEFVQNIGLDYDSKKINELLTFIDENKEKRNGCTLSLTTAMWLYADSKIIETIPHKNENSIQKTEPVIIEKEGAFKFGNKTFTIKKYEENQLFIFPDSTSNFAYIDISNFNFPLELRVRKDGDTIVPFGMQGSMKLKKYMNSKGVSRHNRDEMPLLCKENDVLWVAGVGLSDKISVKTKPSHVIEVS